MTAYFTDMKPYDEGHFIMHTYEIDTDFDFVVYKTRILITNMDTKQRATIYLPYTDVDKELLYDMATNIIKSRGFKI